MSNGRGFDADVILSGGGLVGQTLALALEQAGVRVVVIDASSREVRTRMEGELPKPCVEDA